MFRSPEKGDGEALFNLVKHCSPPLDMNSRYLYYLVAEHFSTTSVVGLTDGAVVAFISAYILPDRPDCLFVWQVGVHESQRGKGVGGNMLDHILARPECRDVRFLETTVTESNRASRRMFEKVAEKRGVKCREELFLGADSFGGTDHEPEILLRIGPFKN